MHQFSKRLTGIAVVAGLGAMTLLGAPQAAQPAAQGAPAQKQKQVKDQGEYDLYNGVVKATDPNKKLELLTAWKEKYPNSDFKDERYTYFYQTYAALGKFAEVISTAKEVLANDPKNLSALYWVTNLTPTVHANSPAADVLDNAERAANGLLGAEMPAGTNPEAWKKAKADLDWIAHRALGWVAWQRKNYESAEQSFIKSLEINAKQGDVSYWLGTVLALQRKPEKQASALYEIARALVLDPTQGGLTQDMRQKLDAYLTKSYTSYHGSEQGLAELKQLAKAQALPPADFKILSEAEIKAAQDEELKKSNPALALWLNLKHELNGPNGAQFFDTNMKGANVPGGAGGVHKLRGYLVSAKPAVRSKELVVALSDKTTGEATLKLETALTGKPEIGGELEFEGVPDGFTKEPFMVTFDQAKISGLKLEAAPTRRPPAKKAGKKRD